MTSRINKILIIGATSGLGEAFARSFHALGKKVIITGRRQERLTALEKELKGVEGIQWDVSDLSSISKTGASILKSHPDLDTVFIMAGIQKSFLFSDASTSTDASIISEVNTNVTAPMLLTRLFFPHLASIAATGKPANLLLVSSGLAYVPIGFYPVYCPTKAAIHSFAITVRQQLNSAPDQVKKNFSICEIAPPYVDTGLDAEHREQINEMTKGRLPPPMGLEDYMQKTMKAVEEVGADGKLKKEVGTGSSQARVDGWRQSVGKLLEGMGIEC